MVAARSNTQLQFVAGDRLVSRLRDLLIGDSVRRFVVRDAEGTALIEIPVHLAGHRPPIAPEVWAAIGAMSRPDVDYQVIVDWRVGAQLPPPTLLRRA